MAKASWIHHQSREQMNHRREGEKTKGRRQGLPLARKYGEHQQAVGSLKKNYREIVQLSQ